MGEILPKIGLCLYFRTEPSLQNFPEIKKCPEHWHLRYIDTQADQLNMQIDYIKMFCKKLQLSFKVSLLY